MSEFPKVIFGYTDSSGNEHIGLNPVDLADIGTEDGQSVGVYEKVGEMVYSSGPSLFAAPSTTATKPKRGRPKGSRSAKKSAAMPEACQ